MAKKDDQYMVSVFRSEGEWDENGIKTLREMGFSQELDVDGKPIKTPKRVFVKYDRADDVNQLRDMVLDKMEKVVKKGSKDKVYVVVTDDLVPLVVQEMRDEGGKAIKDKAACESCLPCGEACSSSHKKEKSAKKGKGCGGSCSCGW